MRIQETYTVFTVDAWDGTLGEWITIFQTFTGEDAYLHISTLISEGDDALGYRVVEAAITEVLR